MNKVREVAAHDPWWKTNSASLRQGRSLALAAGHAQAREARALLVTLADKREFRARVVGTPDKRTDVAVLKIEATGLPSVRIGDANRLKVGEWVMAIGSPFGLDDGLHLDFWRPALGRPDFGAT